MQPFALRPCRAESAGLTRSMVAVAEGLAGLTQLNCLYAGLSRNQHGGAFLEEALRALQVKYVVQGSGIQGIPRRGACVMVANHPFGGVEGLITARLLLEVRSDVKMLGNALLARIPEMRPLLYPVDLFGQRAETVAGNGAALRQALRWLQQGHSLVVFPAGAVSHLQGFKVGITDPPWSAVVGRLVEWAEADVVPVYYPGANGAMFQLLGMLHPRVRTVLLPRELINKRNRTLQAVVGRTIPAARLRSFSDHRQLTGYLRYRTYLLRAALEPPPPRVSAARSMQPVAEPVPGARIQAELGSLSPAHVLVRQGHYVVFVAAADRIPRILREIGRLRELTFRTVGEGTGRASDLDHFDRYYQHLFVWDCRRDRIVGAYRLGLADSILDCHGVQGLYTHSLFHYRRALIERLSPVIELGRSFVQPAYQRDYASLLLLWRGIGAFVARHPRYRMLFGPVSISAGLRGAGQQLLVNYLTAKHYDTVLARLVRPRRPFKVRRRRCHGLFQCADTAGISDALRQLDDGRGMPVLLKHYLRLGGRILAFNVDAQFNDTLDALLMVDLLRADGRILQRYFGAEAYARIRAFHAGGSEVNAG